MLKSSRLNGDMFASRSNPKGIPLVLIDTTMLLKQWRDSAISFCGIRHCEEMTFVHATNNNTRHFVIFNSGHVAKTQPNAQKHEASNIENAIDIAIRYSQKHNLKIELNRMFPCLKFSPSLLVDTDIVEYKSSEKYISKMYTLHPLAIVAIFPSVISITNEPDFPIKYISLYTITPLYDIFPHEKHYIRQKKIDRTKHQQQSSHHQSENCAKTELLC